MALPRNSARSGGPSTATGKSLASQNALKTGSYSVHAVLPGESAEDFQTLVDGLIADFTPRTTMERMLVNDIAILIWKKMRLEKASHAVIASRLSMPPTEIDFKSIFGATSGMPDYVPQVLDRALAMTDGQAMRHKLLMPLLDEWFKKGFHLSKPSGPELQRFAPLLEYFEDYKIRSPVSLNSNGSNDSPQFHPFDGMYEILAEGELRALVWVFARSQSARSAIAEIKSCAILEAMNNSTTSRASDDLNRNLYRALAELRKQQNWRTYVDVEDVERLRTIEGR